MNKLANSKQLLFYKVFSKTQFYSFYWRLKVSISEAKMHVFKRFFAYNSKTEHSIEKIILIKTVAYK